MGSEDLFHKRKAREKSALQRKNAYREQNKRYLVICEGTKTEPNYFQELINDFGISKSQVNIEKNNGSSPDRIVSLAIEKYNEDAKNGDAYDKVYCVFDRDKHTTFDAAVTQVFDLNKTGKPFEAITSTPCFEVWFLLHHEFTDRPFHAAGKKSVGDQVIKQLRTINGFNKYEKGQKGLYTTLKDKLETAIENSRKLREKNISTGSINPATDVDKLIIDVRNLVK